MAEAHDRFCPTGKHDLDHWDPGYHCDSECSDIECLCNFIKAVRADTTIQSNLTGEDMEVVADCLASALDWAGAGAVTGREAAAVLEKIDPAHPALDARA